jgi:hypothetical protein
MIKLNAVAVLIESVGQQRGQNRRLRYIGTEKNRIWLAHRAAAVNLMRMLNLGLSHDGSTWLVATAE